MVNINNYFAYWQFGVDNVYLWKNWRIECRTIFRTKIAAKSSKMSILDNFCIVVYAIRGVSIAILRLWARLDGSIILRKNIMMYVLEHTSAIRADFGIWLLMRQAILAKELSVFASRRKRAAYPRRTNSWTAFWTLDRGRQSNDELEHSQFRPSLPLVVARCRLR